jgi:hypothetical protein
MIQNPLCPALLAPKEMLQGGFGDFYFYEKLRRMAWASTTRDAAEMMRVSSPKGSEQFVELPYHSNSALDVNRRKEYGTGGRFLPKFPPCCCLQITKKL